MPPRPSRRLEIKLEPADETEFGDMCSIFGQAFEFENPKLSQVMYRGRDTESALKDTLERHLPSKYSKFVVAFDITEGFDEDMSYGWISVGVVPHGGNPGAYAAGDLSVYLSFRMLAAEARDGGKDPGQMNTNDPRFRLADELRERSVEGQLIFVADPHMVVNTLALWPDTHSDSTWEMAFKLLGWAVKYAERHD